MWSLSGTKGDKWLQAKVGVRSPSSPYTIVIEGVRGKGIRGDIAVDDISFTSTAYCSGKVNAGLIECESRTNINITL